MYRQSKKAWQFKHDPPLDAGTYQACLQQFLPSACADEYMPLLAVGAQCNRALNTKVPGNGQAPGSAVAEALAANAHVGQ